jgi:hypothetical protein
MRAMMVAAMRRTLQTAEGNIVAISLALGLKMLVPELRMLMPASVRACVIWLDVRVNEA